MSLLMLIGAVFAIAVVVSAAILWSSYTTQSRSPQQVELSMVSDAWSDAAYYETNQAYPIELTATYLGNAESGFNYYITIHETATGGMSADDFTITGTTGDAPGVNLNLEQTVPGTWISTPVMVSAGEASNSVHIIVTPGASASGLSDVSFEIDAVSELPG